MIHVCCFEESIQQQESKVIEREPEENMHSSQLVLQEMDKSSHKAQENLSYLLQIGVEEKPEVATDLRSKLRDSHTVDFMKRFVKENKELGEIITTG